MINFPLKQLGYPDYKLDMYEIFVDKHRKYRYIIMMSYLKSSTDNKIYI